MVLLLTIVLLTSEVSQITASGDQVQGNPPAAPEPDGNQVIPAVSLEKVLGFLQIQEEIHLQKMDEDDWSVSPCHCVKSTFQASHTSGCERKLYCYKYVPVLKAANAVKEPIEKERMIRGEELVDFQVSDIKGLKSVIIKTIDGIEPTEDTPKEFPYTYLVLTADNDCLLVSYGMTNNGQQKCLLWGLSGTNVSEDTECYKGSLLYCPGNLYDITETDSPCLQVDRDEERLNKKAEQEEGTQ
ncbi:uncharacterized protein LOC142569018 isoform X1 [Dermacentor variabilis]|uniref:uncharacterized protein LOC142569018 isoform X1 n=1 Tax=Dermacentor variabilis TaxID=34621 RepID=UPI003F5C74A9